MTRSASMQPGMAAAGEADGLLGSAPWAAQRERGSAVLLRPMLWLVRRLGWAVGQALLLPITAWFLLTSRGARAASREYLGRVLGRPARLSDVARHFHVFACAALDRVFLLTGQTSRYRIEVEGLDAIGAVLAAGQGCVLLGAHLGSFEVLRSVAQRAPVPARALMYRRNAGALTRLLDRLAPDIRASVIEIGQPDTMLRVRESLERGEAVGILADRTPDGNKPGGDKPGGDKVVSVPFLGQPASFPAGPFVLAHALGVPVMLFHAVRTGPRRYQVRFQPFADRVVLRRAARTADLHGYAARYAAVLEQACRAHPYNWFNFFPFWAKPGS